MYTVQYPRGSNMVSLVILLLLVVTGIYTLNNADIGTMKTHSSTLSIAYFLVMNSKKCTVLYQKSQDMSKTRVLTGSLTETPVTK